ncbi:hypothetical protein MCOR27_002298 [Pyricularia oryzae]|nr:hypothetical protein MCOR01_000411 [Pyricularia oryzae]KAI6262078.1 hypothetical protein MCOR19_001746 [Pyricularia oryzae]KAI6282899.1 hypothetical protein MCOR26_002652 [Pyricularia oryzae]KAI6285380.1 hypothetical protein MCOR27_002298 [Pyricularia oryzae]KAI6309673.1 hypothetical protein MCOR34_006688 [Pyricularia oryzae]
MKTKTIFQLVALFAIGATAAPTGCGETKDIQAEAVKPRDVAASQTLHLDARGDIIKGGSSNLERREIWYWCRIGNCNAAFKSLAARCRHEKTAVHIAPESDSDSE